MFALDCQAELQDVTLRWHQLGCSLYALSGYVFGEIVEQWSILKTHPNSNRLSSSEMDQDSWPMLRGWEDKPEKFQSLHFSFGFKAKGSSITEVWCRFHIDACSCILGIYGFGISNDNDGGTGISQVGHPSGFSMWFLLETTSHEHGNVNLLSFSVHSLPPGRRFWKQP